MPIENIMSNILSQVGSEDSDLSNMMNNGSYQKAVSYVFALSSELNVPNEYVRTLLQCVIFNLNFPSISSNTSVGRNGKQKNNILIFSFSSIKNQMSRQMGLTYLQKRQRFVLKNM